MIGFLALAGALLQRLTVVAEVFDLAAAAALPTVPITGKAVFIRRVGLGCASIRFKLVHRYGGVRGDSPNCRIV